MKKCITILMVMLLVLPLVSRAQYFQKLYDIDSSYDWGIDLFINNDSSYQIFGEKIDNIVYKWGLYNIKISSDGNIVMSKKIIQYSNITMGIGYSGATMILSGGNFLAPVNKYMNYGLGIQRGWSGLIKYNANGDTMFLKTHTDTPLYYGGMLTCAIMPSGDYIVGGQSGLYVDPYLPGWIVKKDTMGDSIWSHSYLKYDTQAVVINNIIPLADGRIAVGAYSHHIKGSGSSGYNYYAPWFMILDSMGNILRDTIYNVGLAYGGFIYKDMNGGYYTMGNIDSMPNPDPGDIHNFPSYIAHLDTNFRFTWMTVFPYTDIELHREKYYVKQLRGSSYVIVGDQWSDSLPYNRGWAAKVNRTGAIVWNHYYTAGDTVNDSYIRGVAEKPDGGLVMVGCSHNDTLPTWHTIQDMWLIGVDSNGCENFSCLFPTAAKDVSEPKNEVFSIFPNPTSGNITISAIEGRVFALYSMDGRRVFECAVGKGKMEVRLPDFLSKGVYMGKFLGADGVQIVKRVVID